MIVLDLNQLAGTATAAEGYEGLPGAGGASSAPPGLFANLLTAEQLALMGGTPVAAAAVTDAAPVASSGGEGETKTESPAPPAGFTGVPQGAPGIPAAVYAAAPEPPRQPNTAGSVPQGSESASASAVAATGSAVSQAAAGAESSTAKTAVTQTGQSPPSASPDKGAGPTAPEDPTEGPLFATLAAGKPADTAVKPDVRVHTVIDAANEAAPPGLTSSANVVTTPSRATRPEEPDVVMPSGAATVEETPPADLAARSRAEVVRRKIGDAVAVEPSAAPKAPAAAPAANPASSAPASDTAQPVKPVQVAQLDAQTEAPAAPDTSNAAAAAPPGETSPQPETGAERIAQAAPIKAETDSMAAKAIDAPRDGLPAVNRTENPAVGAAQTTHRVESEPGAPPLMRTPATEFADAAVKSVRYLVSHGENAMRIKLIPENLGEMQLVVRSVGEALHVHVIAAHAHTRDAVEAQMQGLRDQLAKEGIEVARISVASDASGGQQFAQQSNNRDAFGMQQFARDGGPWRGYGHHQQTQSNPNPDPPWTADNRTPRRHAGALNVFA